MKYDLVGLRKEVEFQKSITEVNIKWNLSE